MMLGVYFLTLCAALAAAVPTPTPEPPNGIPQCARSECPVYTYLEDYGSHIFRRRIEPGWWAYKLAPTCNITEATGLVYMSLHQYFIDNSITRTTPIVLNVGDNKARPNFCPDESDVFPCCAEIFGLEFYIPQELQSAVPQPSAESGVHLINASEPREYYGISVVGRPTLENSDEMYNDIVQFLQHESRPYDDDVRLILTYDAPWRPLPHRSEVLIPVKQRRNNSNGGQNGSGRGGRGGRGDRQRQRRALDYHFDVDLIPY